MANEFKHASVGAELSQAEWEAVGAHVFASQVTGDLLYASSASQLSRLAKGTARQLLQMNAGATLPEWATNIDIPGNLDVGNATTLDGSLTVGGGYGATGATISDAGVIQANGAISTDIATASTSKTTGSIIAGGGIGASGSIWADYVVSFSTAGPGFGAYIPAASGATTGLLIIQGNGNGAADNMGYNFEYAPSVSYFRFRSMDIDGSATSGNIFRVNDGTDDMKLYGDITPTADGAGNCGTAALTWADMHTVLFNGADINLDNDWTMLEAEDFPGYPGGWALTHRQPWRKADVLSNVIPGTGSRLFPEGEKPVFAVTEDFIEYKGRRLTPEILDRLLYLVAA
uniref:Uncharacterized protein n=1 Tax=viral metagenome TaxID=1070528 RepID=A0A6M3JR29_9ZZZZ